MRKVRASPGNQYVEPIIVGHDRFSEFSRQQGTYAAPENAHPMLGAFNCRGERAANHFCIWLGKGEQNEPVLRTIEARCNVY